jgi:hypothetical protein
MTNAFQYVDCDVPAGMTLREWRRQQAPAKRKDPLVRLVRPLRRIASR